MPRILLYSRLTMITDDILKHIETELRVAKSRSEQTDADTAEILGVHQSSVSHRLRSHSLPIRDFLNLCYAYGADPRKVFTDALSGARRGELAGGP